MSKLSDASVNIDTAAQKPDNKIPLTKTSHRQVVPYLLEVLIVLSMGVLLFCGTFWQIFATPSDPAIYRPLHADAAKYQCYALAFWQGTRGVSSLPFEQCSFLQTSAPPSLAQRWKARGYPTILLKLVESQSSSQPFHALPYEYPLLAIVPFSLPLVVPSQWYQIAFELLMTLVAGVVYLMLRQFRSTRAAIVFAMYIVVGSWATAGGRFDLIPSALTLGALILAKRARWRWAFLLLALATLFKFYTLVLIVPFLIAQQKQCRNKWYSWRRWDALGVFVLTCAMEMFVSLALSIEDTLAPLSYFRFRPIQAESLPAVLMWLGTFFHHPVYYVKTFGSLNIVSSLSGKVSLLSTLCLVVGLLYTFWLQWRGKLGIFTASLLTLLITIVVGKVFSPQYLIWITPLIAYIGESNWKWLVSWGTVGLLTTWIYPYIYISAPILTVPFVPIFYPVVLVRDAIMLGIVLALLYQATRTSAVLSS